MKLLYRSFAFLISCISLIFLSSCSQMMLMSYGIKNQKDIPLEQVIHLSDKYTNFTPYQFYIDSSFNQFIIDLEYKVEDEAYKLCSSNNSIAYSFKQPIQVLVFNQEGYTTKHFTNCNAGGFPNLKWSNMEQFNFMDSTHYEEHNINFKEIKSYLNTLNEEVVVPDLTEYNRVVLIFWNQFMNRQSRRLVDYLHQNKDENTLYLMVNNDNFYPNE